MESIKKHYLEIATLLNANQAVLVSEIMPALLEIMTKSRNAGGSNSLIINGKVVAVYCYYHKCWENVNRAEYGIKKSTSTGLASMCKEGVSKWVKQQSNIKAYETSLLQELMDHKVEVEDIDTVRNENLTRIRTIVPREDGHGHDEVEDIYIEDEEDAYTIALELIEQAKVDAKKAKEDAKKAK